jgi:hypothetical protein
VDDAEAVDSHDGRGSAVPMMLFEDFAADTVLGRHV